MEAMITDIKRFAVHDGDGIRTTVFFKGCPLRCAWCHNPETLTAQPQISYFAHKCVGCGACVQLCGANVFDGIHRFDREKCDDCGRCAQVCPNGAFRLNGMRVTVEELLPKLTEDRIFYESGDGGVTLSGGECLCQSDFCAELLRRCKEEGLNTAVDTCGFVPREAFDAVLPYTDTFLYDIKAIDPEVHRRCTGVSNEVILENIKYLDHCGATVEVRIPFIPDYNADQIGKIGEFLRQIKNLVRVRILPYHDFAGSKYEALGMENILPAHLPEAEELAAAEQQLQAALHG